MSPPFRGPRLAVTSAAALLAFAVFAVAPPANAADPAASAFGANVQVTGQDVVPPTPSVAVATVPGDATNTLVDIPASPVAINGTLTATANVHTAADIPTGLTVVQQAVAGPYNGRGLAQIEGVSVLYGVVGAQVPLLSAAAVRSEAAVVCGAPARYTANSELVDLSVGGSSIPANAPVTQVIDAISGVLTTSGLSAVADVQRNVVTQIAGGGVRVDALVVTVLSAAGNVPLAQVRLAHAEVTAAACAAKPACSDGADNDGDVVIDAADPGCHTDGDVSHLATYNPNDTDEANDAKRAAAAAAALPRTGSEAGLPLVAAGLVTLAALGMRLRRRLVG